MSINRAFYQHLQSGPSTEAALRKAGKAFEDTEVDEAINTWKTRGWVELDESGKTPKFALTEQGRNDMSARYPET